MTNSHRPPADPSTTAGSGGPKWGQLLAGFLLLGEFLWLAGRFTTATLPKSDEDWVRLMRQANYLPQVGLAVLTVLLLFRRTAGSAAIEEEVLPHRLPSRLAALFIAQLGAFALFMRSTAGIFEEHLAGVEEPLRALAVWVVLALVTTLLGVLLFVPLPALLRGLRQRAGFLAGGCILGLTAWSAGHYAANELSPPLQASTLWLVGKLLGLCGSGYVVDVSSFEIRSFDPAPGFWVRVAPSCSGLEGIGLMAIFAVSFVWLFRERLRFPQLLLLPLAGVTGIWLLNAVRIVALVLIGTHVSAEAAVAGFHSLAGTLAFCLAALALVVASTRLNFFAAVDEHRWGAHERDSTAAYLVPFLITVALGMIDSALGESGQMLQPLRVIAPAFAVWSYRRTYAITIPRGWAIPLVLGAVAFAVWIGIPRTDASALADGRWLPIRILGSLCIAPLVEELAFRGYLARRLTSGDFEAVTPRRISILAWVISSLLFGVLHGHWIAATIAGGLYGFAYMRRGQLFDCILAHAFTNSLLVVLALASGDWSLL